MRSLLTVALQELVVNVRRPGFIIMTLLDPGAGRRGTAGRFGLWRADRRHARVPVRAEPGRSRLRGSQQPADRQILPDYMSQMIPYPDEAAARAALLAKEIDSYFVVPEDYVQTARSRSTAPAAAFRPLPPPTAARSAAF